MKFILPKPVETNRTDVRKKWEHCVGNNLTSFLCVVYFNYLFFMRVCRKISKTNAFSASKSGLSTERNKKTIAKGLFTKLKMACVPCPHLLMVISYRKNLNNSPATLPSLCLFFNMHIKVVSVKKNDVFQEKCWVYESTIKCANTKIHGSK